LQASKNARSKIKNEVIYQFTVREVPVTGKQDAVINKTIGKIKIRDIYWFTMM
jgi:hypothetical protein